MVGLKYYEDFIFEGNKEKYLRVRTRGIRELDKMIESFSEPLAKEILRSLKSFFIAFGELKNKAEEKELKNKHKKKAKEYAIEIKALDKKVKNEEGKGYFKRMVDNRIRQTTFALNQYKKGINHWKL